MAEDVAKKNFKRRSLNTKTFLILLMIVLGMGGTILVAGFLLYASGVADEFYVSTWNQANAEAAVVEQKEYRDKCDEILSIYDSFTEEERGDGMAPEYQAHFDAVLDTTFRNLQQSMRDLKNRNGPMNAFIVAMDREHRKMIYLVDSDPNEETFCWPGTWQDYSQKEVNILIDGRDLTRLEKKQGIEQRVQSVITDLPLYGVRCTGGSTLYETDRYTVMVCVDEKLDPAVERSKSFLTQYVILLVIATLISAFIGMIVMRRNIVRPINRMTKAAKGYGEDRQKQDSGFRHFNDLNIKTGDEIENLAQTLKEMEDDLSEYVENLTSVTAEKERISTELDLAARIQQSMLPSIFPPFPERSEFDIYATMEPAKEVGGDFYDFFIIDDDHVGIEIADVSDKGVPAALFMMASKILLANKAAEGLTPAQVLEAVNERICNNNSVEMFVTVWLGILEISTGKLTAANAGHEYPIMIWADGSAELIHDKHGFVIGALPDRKYTDYEIQMNRGDRIFVYTDGVTEATSETGELFGLERTLAAAENLLEGASPRQVLDGIHHAVEQFVGEAEQFDDLTMLCLVYRGEEKDA